PHGLPRLVVRVLPQNHHAHVVWRGELERAQDLVLRGIDDLVLAQALHLAQQALRVAANLIRRAVKPEPHVVLGRVHHDTSLVCLSQATVASMELWVKTCGNQLREMPAAAAGPWS